MIAEPKAKTPREYKAARLARLRKLAKRETKNKRDRKRNKAKLRSRRILRQKQQKAVVVMMATRNLPSIVAANHAREVLCERLRELALTKRGLVEALMGIANESRDIQDQIKRIDERDLRELGLLPEQSLKKEPVRIPLKLRAA